MNDKSTLKKLIIFTNAGLNSSFQCVHELTQNSTIIEKTCKTAKCYELKRPSSKTGKEEFDSLKKHLEKDLKSDLERLCEELIKYVTTTKDQDCMVLDKDYFNYYHTALIDEKNIVIEKIWKEGKLINREGKFTQEFIDGDDSLSCRAKKSRSLII